MASPTAGAAPARKAGGDLFVPGCEADPEDILLVPKAGKLTFYVARLHFMMKNGMIVLTGTWHCAKGVSR